VFIGPRYSGGPFSNDSFELVGVGSRFVLEDSEACANDSCFLSLQYLKPGSADKRFIQFNLQGAVYRSFY